jgi:hypothetical protein
VSRAMTPKMGENNCERPINLGMVTSFIEGEALTA